MSKTFDLTIRVRVYDLDSEDEEYLRDDAADFIFQADLLDDATFTITEVL